jgi:hypothetical protein
MAGCGDDLPAVTIAINRANDNRAAPIPAGSYTDLMNDQTVEVTGDYTLGPRSFAVLR